MKAFKSITLTGYTATLFQAGYKIFSIASDYPRNFNRGHCKIKYKLKGGRKLYGMIVPTSEITLGIDQL